MTPAQEKVLATIDGNNHVGFGAVDANPNAGQVNLSAARALVRRGVLVERTSPDGGPMFKRVENDEFAGHHKITCQFYGVELFRIGERVIVTSKDGSQHRGLLTGFLNRYDGVAIHLQAEAGPWNIFITGPDIKSVERNAQQAV